MILEDDVNGGEAEGRGGADDLHARQALEVDDEGIGDLILHLLRTPSQPFGEDDDLVLRKVRDGVDGGLEQGPDPPANEQGIKGDYQEPMPEAPLADPLDHQTLPLLRKQAAPLKRTVNGRCDHLQQPRSPVGPGNRSGNWPQ